jgi:hypothetical protein
MNLTDLLEKLTRLTVSFSQQETAFAQMMQAYLRADPLYAEHFEKVLAEWSGLTGPMENVTPKSICGHQNEDMKRRNIGVGYFKDTRNCRHWASFISTAARRV